MIKWLPLVLLMGCGASRGPERDRPFTSYAVESVLGEGRLEMPMGLGVTSDGTLVVADTGHGRLVVFGPSLAFAREITGLERPMDVAIGVDGSYFVADLAREELVCLRPDGSPCSAVRREVSAAVGVAVEENGTLLVAEPSASRVRAIAGPAHFSLGSRGGAAGQLAGPTDALAFRDGSLLVADADNDRLQRFDLEGRAVATWQGPAADPFVRPTGIAESRGIIHVADSGRRRVVALSTRGDTLFTWTLTDDGHPEIEAPARVAAHGDRVYVADPANDRVVVLRLAH